MKISAKPSFWPNLGYHDSIIRYYSSTIWYYTYFLWTAATTTDVKITNNSLGRDISREYCLSMGPVYSKIFLNINYTLSWINHFTSFISFASKHVYFKKNIQNICIICRKVRFRLLYKYMHTFVRIHWFVNICCNRKQ